MEKIGLVGVGTMGSRMLKNILKGGYTVYTFDIAPSAQEYAASVGAVVMDNARQVAEQADIVITSLPSSVEVKQVTFDPDGLAEGFRPGSVLLEMSSSLPADTRMIAEKLREIGIAMVDAPVSGGSKGAENGTLSIMIGGDLSDVERVTPLLRTLGTRLTYVGSVSMGHTAKAINNMLFGTTLIAACEALILGAKEGLDIDTLIEIIQQSSGQCYSINKINNYALEDNYVPGFSLDLLVKDVRTAFSMADSMTVPLSVSHAAKEILMLGQARGWGKEDNTKILNILEEQCAIAIARKHKKE